MAKISSLFGTGSGSIGNITLRSHKTSSGTRSMVASTKVTNPTNPRTSGQMLQRAKFATAAKFYARSTRNFFKFAYEDKRSNESDYNAFMRHNIANAVPMIKAQNDSPRYPALGKDWMLTQGSLQGLDNVWVDDKFYLVRDLDMTGGVMTVALISKALIAKGFKAGQIFTLVTVYTDVPSSAYYFTSADTVANAGINPPVWNISQIIIDPTDGTLLENTNHIGPDNYMASLEFDGTEITHAEANGSNNCVWMCGIISERVSGSSKLLVSSSWLRPNANAQAILQNISSSAYYANMLVSWGADPNEVILKGAIAGTGEFSPYPEILSVNGQLPPVITTTAATVGTDISLSIGGAYFDSEREITEDSFTCVGADVKSFAVGTGNNATLVVTPTATGVAVYYTGGGSAQLLYQAGTPAGTVVTDSDGGSTIVEGGGSNA